MTMLGLYYNAVLMCVMSTAICSAIPQHLFEDGPFQNQRKHAIDFFSTRLVGNPKVRRNYLNCFLDNGPCSPEAKNIKRMVPDAIKNECEHCTELQKKLIEKMMCYLNNEQPEILKQVAAKFDPNGEYMKKYIDNIEKDPFFNTQLQSPKSKFQPQPQKPLVQDQNQQQPHQNNHHHDQNQPHQGQNQSDQNQNKNHHPQPDQQQPHQNHQPPPQNQPPSHHHPHQQPQNPNQQQPQNPHQQQPQTSHHQQPQNLHEQQPQNQHEQQPQNPHQQQPHHHHHHPQQPQQNQQPQQH